MSLLNFLPAEDEHTTTNQAAVTSATREQEKWNEVRSMTPEQQKEKAKRKTKETIESLKAWIIRDGY